MLPKKYRLGLRTERQRVTATGKTLHSQLFTIIATAQNSPSLPRFAVIVSTKFHPHSVQRHRIKRLIHQILQENLSSLPQNRDIIIIPKKTVLTADKSTVASDLLRLLAAKD